MRQTMEREWKNPAVQGLIVDYTHFYGSYWTQTCGFGWYPQEVRVVRQTKQSARTATRKAFEPLTAKSST